MEGKNMLVSKEDEMDIDIEGMIAQVKYMSGCVYCMREVMDADRDLIDVCIKLLGNNKLREQFAAYTETNMYSLIEDGLLKEAEKGNFAGVIKASIEKSVKEYEVGALGFYYGDFEKGTGRYIMIVTIDGIFFFVDDKMAFVSPDSIKDVKADPESLRIRAVDVKWFSRIGDVITGDDTNRNEIIYVKGDGLERYFSAIKRGLYKLKDPIGEQSQMDNRAEVEKVLRKYIDYMAKPYCNSRIIADVDHSNKKESRRLVNILKKLASKADEDTAIGFIDTSLFGNGKDGLVFYDDGIVFDYAFEKVFLEYKEIQQMIIDKGELIFVGCFRNRKNDLGNPVLCDVYFDVSAVKECIEMIKCVA